VSKSIKGALNDPALVMLPVALPPSVPFGVKAGMLARADEVIE